MYLHGFLKAHKNQQLILAINETSQIDDPTQYHAMSCQQNQQDPTRAEKMLAKFSYFTHYKAILIQPNLKMEVKRTLACVSIDS